LVNDNNELISEIDVRNKRIAEMTVKQNEIKRHLASLQAMNKSLYDEIVHYEEVNNRMED